MIEVQGLTKRYGAKTAVDGLTFGIEPGKVTGFLGPNGAGKTTTMRCILGLDYPDAGTVTVDGRDYRDLGYPMREVGALLDAEAIGDIAFEQAIRLHELTTVRASLEEAFMELTASSVEYHAGIPDATMAIGSGV